MRAKGAVLRTSSVRALSVSLRHSHCSAVLSPASWSSSAISPAPGRAERSGSSVIRCCRVTGSVPGRQTALQMSSRRSSGSFSSLNVSVSSLPSAPCRPASRRDAKSSREKPILGGVSETSSTVPCQVVLPSHSVRSHRPSPSRTTRRTRECVLSSNTSLASMVRTLEESAAAAEEEPAPLDAAICMLYV